MYNFLLPWAFLKNRQCSSWLAHLKMYIVQSPQKANSSLQDQIPSLTLGPHHTVERVAADEHALRLTSPVGFQNINGIDGIARLASHVCVFYCKYSIYDHVGKEITISKPRVKENKRHGMDNRCTQKSREFKGTSFQQSHQRNSINHAIKMLEYYLSLLAIRSTVTLYYSRSPQKRKGANNFNTVSLSTKSNQHLTSIKG